MAAIVVYVVNVAKEATDTQHGVGEIRRGKLVGYR
jgi:hypothetical protein